MPTLRRLLSVRGMVDMAVEEGRGEAESKPCEGESVAACSRGSMVCHAFLCGGRTAAAPRKPGALYVLLRLRAHRL